TSSMCVGVIILRSDVKLQFFAHRFGDAARPPAGIDQANLNFCAGHPLLATRNRLIQKNARAGNAGDGGAHVERVFDSRGSDKLNRYGAHGPEQWFRTVEKRSVAYSAP